MPTNQTMTFELAFDDFDLDVLPVHARDVSTDAFRRAVTAYFEGEFADLDGQVTVDFGTDRLIVTWEPTGATRDLFDDALALLQQGKLREAVPLLKGPRGRRTDQRRCPLQSRHGAQRPWRP